MGHALDRTAPTSHRLIALGLSGRAKEGIALAADLPDPMIVPLKSIDLLLARGQLRLWSDDLPGARQDLLGAVANCRTTTVPLRLLSASALAQTLHRLGAWDEALIHAESSASIADDTDQSWLKPVTHGVSAQILAARGIETESEDIRKDMVKKLERQKIQLALNNMRDAGIRSFAFFIFGYPGESPATIEQTIDYAIELNPDFANFYPAVPYPGTELYNKVVRDGMLVEEDWTRMEYSYYLLRGNGLDEHVVMSAINRAKRRFFMRPAYLASRLGDVMKLAFT